MARTVRTTTALLLDDNQSTAVKRSLAELFNIEIIDLNTLKKNCLYYFMMNK